MIKTYLLPLFLSAQTWDMCFKWLFFYVYMLSLCTSTDLILCVLLDILGEYHSYWPLTRLCVAVSLFTNGFPASLVFRIIDNLATNILGQKKRKEKKPADLHFG